MTVTVPPLAEPLLAITIVCPVPFHTWSRAINSEGDSLCPAVTAVVTPPMTIEPEEGAVTDNRVEARSKFSPFCLTAHPKSFID